LERIVGRALKKRREERYASMGEMLADIRALREGRSTQTRLGTRNQVPGLFSPRKPRWFVALVVATLLALIAAAVLIWRASQPSLTQPSARKASTKQASSRLAVLPFRFVGPGQRNEKIAEEVISVLSNKLIQLDAFQGLLSVSSVADALKEKVTNPQEAMARLGANLALTGAVVEENDRFIVTADLLDAQKQIVVNSTYVEGSIDQLPTLRESLLQKVAEILQTQVREANEARGLCQQARGYLGRYDRTQNLEIAIQLFGKALQRDPSYALAHAGRAEAYLRNYRLTTDALSLERARDGLQAAMHFNAEFVPVHFAMGLYQNATGNYEGAVESFQRSLKIEPGPDAARELGNSYNALNRLEAAEAAYAQAIQMRRGYWAGYKDLAVFYNKHGRFKEARPLLERVAQLAPDDYSSYTNLGALYVKLGMFPEGAAVLRQAVSIDPSAMAYYQLGTALYLGHRYPEAVEAYENAVTLNPTDAETWGALGQAAYWVPGMSDSMVNAFKKALALAADPLKIRPRDARLRAEIASWLVYTDKRAALRHRPEIESAGQPRSGPRRGSLRAEWDAKQSDCRVRSGSQARRSAGRDAEVASTGKT
jgi:tetratricopeptide (TPR) repeat protein